MGVRFFFVVDGGLLDLAAIRRHRRRQRRLRWPLRAWCWLRGHSPAFTLYRADGSVGGRECGRCWRSF
jgi:hypothetical protein